MLGRLVEDDAHPEPARPALRHRRLALAVLVLEPGVGDVGRAIAVALVSLLLGARLPPEVELHVVVGDLAGFSDHLELAALDEHRAGAEAPDGAHVVRHEQDRLALVLHAVEHVEALLLEGRVAHREHLVDQEDVGVHLDHHREGEPHVHARGVVLELEVDELLEFRELDHPLEPLARVARG